MKKFTIYLAALIMLLPAVACEKFLDVQPRDKFLESQVFSTESGIQSALNNVYLGMAKNNLYGGNLTLSTVEALAQRYNLSSSSNRWRHFSQYNFGEDFARSTFNNIWSDTYRLILDLNNFMSGLDAYPGVVSSAHSAILKGEAYGLRALLHFDLYRLFGPLPGEDSTVPAIPYYLQATATPQTILQSGAVLEAVLKDLDSAATLLADDPIIAEGVRHGLQHDGEDFYRYRNYRMNYYAVKALQARVNLYAGRAAQAYTAATAVIDNTDQWFPWTPPSQVISENQNPDRVFSSEVIFGVQNMSLYDQHNALFNSNLLNSAILAPVSGRLANAFENNENDYRYNPNWKIPTNGAKDYRTFFKYEDVMESTMGFRFLQPLIRLTEMYYIAAETDPDPLQGLAYLNTARFNRGLIDLASSANLQAEIEKEYIREFYGEGQLFFYYKRVGKDTLPNGSSASGNVTMDADKYVIPLPSSETEYRN